MCNLYSMTATVDEMRRIFGPFSGDTTNVPAYDEIYPGHSAPVLVRAETGLALQKMKWGFPGPASAGSRQIRRLSRHLRRPTPGSG
jgi:putative SOS response-associated peptidase YedK